MQKQVQDSSYTQSIQSSKQVGLAHAQVHTMVQDKQQAGQEHSQQQDHELNGLAGREEQQKAIGVLLVDDHALAREGLRYLFTQQRTIHLVGEATEHADVIRLIDRLHPDIVLLGTYQAYQAGTEALALTRRITHTYPDVAVVLLSNQSSQQYVVQAFKSGVRGYVLTTASPAEVTRAVRIVHDGGTYIGQELASALADGLRATSNSLSLNEYLQNGRRREAQLLDVLTEKELELVRLVATGMSNKEIAETLAYSEKTVKNYLSVIFQKLNVRDRTQVAIMALKQGILTDC